MIQQWEYKTAGILWGPIEPSGAARGWRWTGPHGHIHLEQNLRELGEDG